MIICAGKNESFDFARSVGIGLIESAIQLTKIVIEEKPTSLFFVGTAGSYGNYKPFDVVPTNRASNIELGFLDNLCYTPIQNQIKIVFNDVSHETNCQIMPIVNSSNYITTDKKASLELLKMGLELENMEFYSILHVAQIFKIPCFGLFVITNYCDKNAHQDFIQNHAKAKELIALHVEKNMKIYQ